MRTEQFPIYQVLQHYGFDVIEGHYGKVRCAFHGDRVASATWSEFYFKCFGCDMHGDAVRLIKEADHIEWDEAYSRAKDLTGVRHDGVREEPGPSRGLSFEQRLQRGNRKFVPPGSSRRPGTGR